MISFRVNGIKTLPVRQQHPNQVRKSALCMLDYSWNLGTPDLFVCADFRFRPWFGMNTKKGVWEPIGSANTPVAFIALEDIGKAIASLARLPPSEVPDDVRIVGDNISFKDAAEAMTAVSGNKIELNEIELGPFKAKTTEKTEGDL